MRGRRRKFEWGRMSHLYDFLRKYLIFFLFDLMLILVQSRWHKDRPIHFGMVIVNFRPLERF